jgi:hypothetical protein
VRALASVAAGWALASLACAAQAQQLSATLARIVGEVSVRHPGRDWTPAAAGQKLVSGDDVLTGADSEATIAFPGGDQVVIRELTDLAIGTLLRESGRQKVRVLLKVGEIGAKIEPRRTLQPDFSIRTPTATASVRGTVFKRVSYYTPRGMETELAKGAALIQSLAGRFQARPGQPTVAGAGRGPGRFQGPRDVRARGQRARTEPAGMSPPERRQIGRADQPRTNPGPRPPGLPPGRPPGQPPPPPPPAPPP